MQTYQRITQNMFRYMPKYASIILNLNTNHQIKSAVYRKRWNSILKFFLILTFSLSPVFAETFNAALKRAYETNPELNAERESINISEQELRVSKSSYLPTITLEGRQSQEDT